MPLHTPADPRRVTRLDRSIVCGKAMASARRMARQFGGRFADYLSWTMARAWAEQRAHIARRVAMSARFHAAVAGIRADFAAEQTEKAASFETYWFSRRPVEQAVPEPMRRAA